MEDLQRSLGQYNEQLTMVSDAIAASTSDAEREPLLALQSELTELIDLTKENVDSLVSKQNVDTEPSQAEQKNELDDEYALFMQEMAESGAYETNNEEGKSDKKNDTEGNDSSDIEDELSALLGMKCAVYHTHKWGGQPTLHNGMVSAMVPHQDKDQFKDLLVRVLFTHPTHTEMLPCPFYLDGECRFNDEQCRYSHGTVVPLSDLKDAIEPNFESVKIGSRILTKLKPPEDEDIQLTKKSAEKYHLWHRSIVTSIDVDKKVCFAKLEHGIKTGNKRKSGTEEFQVSFEEIFPLNTETDTDSDSDDSISDTEYPEHKVVRTDTDEHRSLLIEKSLQHNGPALGEWERHTKGIGSKLMLAMGYVPGAGLGASGGGRVEPVEARVLPVGKSLDHCMEISERNSGKDPLKVQQKLQRLQKKEEERNKRAYEREKERERRNVFNFLNKTLGDKSEEGESSVGPSSNIKQSSSKNLNIEQFKITEDKKRLEREIFKLNSSLTRHAHGSEGYRNLNIQLVERNKELNALKNKEQLISKEQNHRKNKNSMASF